jgi:hypothetical protein
VLASALPLIELERDAATAGVSVFVIAGVERLMIAIARGDLPSIGCDLDSGNGAIEPK